MPTLDEIRKEVSKNTSDEAKSLLGQYLTPCSIANFMASLFTSQKLRDCSILDPGAGIGTLSASLVSCIRRNQGASIASLTAVELDKTIVPILKDTFSRLSYNNAEVVQGDFLEIGLNWLQFEPQKCFSHIIMNPPYKKISSNSISRKLLRNADIETVNLYSGFVALCIRLLNAHGELVAIIPRSFCNGPYYKAFRKIILTHTQISHIHLFDSRKNNFRDDEVLQENIILKLVKEPPMTHTIKISTSTDGSFSDYNEYSVSSEAVVESSDAEFFIRVPELKHFDVSIQDYNITNSLDSLNLSVSTGPVVDFRAKKHLSQMPEPETVPLVYPLHLNMTHCIWPQANSKKANSIYANNETRRMFFPSGYYCAVKRFSAKEEKRRITACVISPSDFGEPQYFAFENHLNIFHVGKKGLDKAVAYGLMVFLNSSIVDRYFRSFNGHTQVNATDLKQMYYPSLQELMTLGVWAQKCQNLTFELIDDYVERTLCQHNVIAI